MTGDEELNIINRIKEGDKELYSAIVDEYSERLFLFVSTLTRDGDVAQDILQETFVKAFFKIGKFRGESSFFTWLNRIAYNETISYLRRSRKNVKIPVFDDPDKAVAYIGRLSGADLTEETDEIHEKAVERSKMEEKILASLELLNAEERALLDMFYYKQESIKKICEITAMGESNVKVKLFRAKKHLRRLVECN
jgi:RNA polymerase sigma-70 factor, ECF subfamily